MGKILDAVFGRENRNKQDRATERSFSRPNGSTLGLTTPVTWSGNTVMGPAGGRATKFATTDSRGNVTNVKSIPNSAWSAQSRSGQPRGSLFGGMSRDKSGRQVSSGGGPSRSNSRGSSRDRSGGSLGVKSGTTTPSSYSQGGNKSSTKKREGGIVEGKKWIQGAIKKKGALRSALKVKKGSTIPTKKLAAAAKKPGKIGQRARLAMTLKSFRKSK